MNSINCKGKLINVSQPMVMGIINATPDSFYEGHLKLNTEQLIQFAGQMINSGAGILDIGGISTKPGSNPISIEEEIDRVLPAIESIHSVFPEMVLSIDTHSSKVAKEAVKAGASIINDISAGNLDEQMIETVASLQVPDIIMHMQGVPSEMQKNPVYKEVVKEVLDFFILKIESCSKAGIKDLIIDPGFGFGKTIEHNFQLLKELSALTILNKPILVGLSRKSIIYKTLNVAAIEALNGTTVLNTIALLNGARILRVHDVKEATEAVRLFNAYKKAP